MLFIKENFISFSTIFYREFTRILRIWPQTILPSVITMILYFLIFGNLIGSRVGIISGYNYLYYIIPGLIMMSVITTSYTNVVSSFFGSKFQKNIEELLISPTYNYIIILGFIFGGMFRSMVVCIFVILIANFFCRFYIYNFYIFFIILILTSLLFSLAGLLNGILAEKFDDVSIIPTFILTPLIYLGGIFYSIDLLPSFLKNIVYFNPIFYIVNIFRYASLGISEVNIIKAFVFMLFFIVFLFFICNFLLNIGYKIKK